MFESSYQSFYDLFAFTLSDDDKQRDSQLLGEWAVSSIVSPKMRFSCVRRSR
ncbi:MAG: hypothetical protein GXY83_27995 [Rhodopirellula sp.]|nr:hypothetical protein [Rhodopirellula sp.]